MKLKDAAAAYYLLRGKRQALYFLEMNLFVAAPGVYRAGQILYKMLSRVAGGAGNNIVHKVEGTVTI